MAAEVVIKFSAEDDASKALLELIKQTYALAKAEEEAAKKTEEANKEISKAEKLYNGLKGAASSAAKVGFSALAAGAVALTGALVGLYAAGAAHLEAWKEQDQVNNSVADSLTRAGVAASDVQARFDELNQIAGDLASKTMFGDEDVLRAADEYIRMTGQAKVATEDLSTILGIAAKTQKSTTDAAKEYAKAAKGDIGSLKELTKLTVDQEAALNAISDPALKAAKAQELLRAQFKGVAEDVNPTFNAIKNLSDAQGDLSQMIGSVIDKSGIIPAVLDPVTQAFRAVESWVNANHVTLQRYLIGGLDLLVGKIQWLAPYVEGLIGLFIDVSVTVENTGNYIGLMAAAAKMGFLQISEQAHLMVRDVLEQLAAMTRGIASQILPINESLAQQFFDAAGAVGALTESVDKSLADTSNGWKQAKEDAERYMAAIASNDKLGKQQAEGVRSFFGAIDSKLAEVRANLARLDREASAPAVRASQGKGPAAPAAPALSSQAGADAAKRQALARADLAVLLEQNEAKKAALQLERDLLDLRLTTGLTAGERELKQAQAMISYKETLQGLDDERAQTLRDGQLTIDLMTTQNELTRAQLEYRKELADLEASRDLAPEEKALELKRIELEYTDKLRQARLADARAQAAQIAAQATQLAQLAGAVDETKALGLAFAGLAQVTADARSIQAEYAAGLISGAQAAERALGAASSAAMTFADQMGASAAQQAAILAIFEAAAAAASYATGNVPGGVQHTIASGLYASVAATSASGAKGGAGAGAAGAGSSLIGPPIDMAKERRQSADYIAEALGKVLSDRPSQVIIYDNRGQQNTTLERSPAVQDKIFKASSQGAARSGLDLDQLRKTRG